MKIATILSAFENRLRASLVNTLCKQIQMKVVIVKMVKMNYHV